MARLTIPDEPTFAEFTVVTSTSVFPISFSLFAKADLTVLVSGVALAQSAFTFTGTLLAGGGYDGGTVTLNAAVTTGTVRVERNVAAARTSNFAPANTVPVQSVDAALNRLTAGVQDLARKKASLPAGTRAGLFAAFDSAGDMIASPGSIPGGVAVSSFGASLALTGTDTSARALLKTGDTGVDVKTRYGLTALNDAADQAKIVTALAALPVSSTAYFREGAGAYKLASSLVVSRAMDFQNELNATFRLDIPSTDLTSSVIRINVLELPDQINIPGATVRGMQIEGGRVFSFNTTASTVNTAGAYGIAINDMPDGPLTATNLTGDYYAQIGLRLKNMVIAGRLGAIFVGGTVSEDSFFFGGPEFCSLENGCVFSNVPDGQRALWCQSFGLNPAYTLNAVPGAYNHSFIGGTVANRDGVGRITNGDRVLFENIQVELAAVHGAVGGQYLWVEGVARPSIGNQVIGNNFGSSTNRNYTFRLDNADNFLIDRNYLGKTALADVFIGTSTFKSLIWGENNVFRGARTRLAVAAYTVTDPTRLARVTFNTGLGPYTGGVFYGMWVSAADVLLTGGGFGSNGLEFMLERSGRVGFQGLWSGGLNVPLPAGTTIMTVPVSMRPQMTQNMIVAINDVPHVLTVTPAGLVYSQLGLACPAATSLNLNMTPAFYYAVTNVPYEAGVS